MKKDLNTEQLEFEVRFYEKIITNNPDFIDALIPLANNYTLLGLHKKGLSVDRRLVKLKNTDPISYYNLSCSYSLLQMKDEALKALEKAILLGYDDITHLMQDADFANIRDDVRFRLLVNTLSEKLLKTP